MQRLSVAITTAPRPESYLGRTLASLTAAGATDIHVFSEPGTDLRCLQEFPASLIQRKDRRGNFRNWMEAARAMLDTGAEMILMAEDDVLFGQSSLKDALDVWSTLGNVGFLSLYTATHYQLEWHLKIGDRIIKRFRAEDVARGKVETHPGSHVEPYEFPEGVMAPQIDSLYGALALLFHRDILARVVENDVAKFWKDRYRHLPSSELSCVDTCIGEIMNVLHLKMWFFNPGRAQHIGEKSSIDVLREISPFRRSHKVLL